MELNLQHSQVVFSLLAFHVSSNMFPAYVLVVNSGHTMVFLNEACHHGTIKMFLEPHYSESVHYTGKGSVMG